MKRWYLCPMEQVTEADGFTFWRPRVARYPVAWTVDVDDPTQGWAPVLVAAVDHSAIEADPQCIPLPLDLMVQVQDLSAAQRAHLANEARVRGVDLGDIAATDRAERFLERFGKRVSPTFDPRRMNVREVV
jgi:hypothetical protein